MPPDGITASCLVLMQADAAGSDNDVIFESTFLPTAADDSVTSNILEVFSDSDSTQTQASETDSNFGSEPIEESLTLTPFRLATEDFATDDLVADRRETRSVEGGLPVQAIPMEGSMASAAWTGFDQLAQQREDLDDSLSWSIVVSPTYMSGCSAEGSFHCLNIWWLSSLLPSVVQDCMQQAMHACHLCCHAPVASSSHSLFHQTMCPQPSCLFAASDHQHIDVFKPVFAPVVF